MFWYGTKRYVLYDALCKQHLKSYYFQFRDYFPSNKVDIMVIRKILFLASRKRNQRFAPELWIRIQIFCSIRIRILQKVYPLKLLVNHIKLNFKS